MNASIVMGISIDSLFTHSITSTSRGKEVYRSVQKTPSNQQSLFKYLTDLITQTSWRYGELATIGISTSDYFPKRNERATTNHDIKGHTSSNQTAGLPLAQLAVDLTNHFNCDCLVMNHSQSAVIREFQHSSHLDNAAILSASLSDGCNLSFYTKKKLMPHSLCSGWAHSPLPQFQWLIDGLTPVCHCGHEACVEQFISAQGIERQYHQVVLQDRPLTQIFSAVTNSDPNSTRVYRAFVDQLARSLISPIQKLRPSHLILSGKAVSYSLLHEDLKVALSRYSAPYTLPIITQQPQDEFTFAYGASLVAIKNNNNHLRS